MTSRRLRMRLVSIHEYLAAGKAIRATNEVAALVADLDAGGIEADAGPDEGREMLAERVRAAEGRAEAAEGEAARLAERLEQAEARGRTLADEAQAYLCERDLARADQQASADAAWQLAEALAARDRRDREGVRISGPDALRLAARLVGDFPGDAEVVIRARD